MKNAHHLFAVIAGMCYVGSGFFTFASTADDLDKQQQLGWLIAAFAAILLGILCQVIWQRIMSDEKKRRRYHLN